MEILIETATNYYGVDWLAMTLSFLFLYFIGGRNRYPFVIRIVANIAWIAFSVMADSMANLISSFIFIALHIRGFINWENKQS